MWNNEAWNSKEMWKKETQEGETWKFSVKTSFSVIGKHTNYRCTQRGRLLDKATHFHSSQWSTYSDGVGGFLEIWSRKWHHDNANWNMPLDQMRDTSGSLAQHSWRTKKMNLERLQGPDENVAVKWVQLIKKTTSQMEKKSSQMQNDKGRSMILFIGHNLCNKWTKFVSYLSHTILTLLSRPITNNTFQCALWKQPGASLE